MEKKIDPDKPSHERDLWDWLQKIAVVISSEFPKKVYGPLGEHGVRYSEDEDGFLFATIGLNLPKGLYAEIEHGTYGELQGIRIYLENQDQPFPDVHFRIKLLNHGGND